MAERSATKTPALHEVVVLSRRREAEDIDSFVLDATVGPLPPFEAGAHVDVHLPDGPVRPYSLCNPPSSSGPYEIAVLCDPAGRGGSRAAHALTPGTTLRISAPRNNFPLHPGGDASVLIAGGIGVTPILSMAADLRRRASPFCIHYGARSRGRAAFLDRFGRDHDGLVNLYFDDVGDRMNLDGLAAQVRDSGHLYVCGPPGMIAAVRESAARAGVPEERVHFERFAAAAELASATDEGFEVVLASTGLSLAVAPDTTILEALTSAGVEVQASCESGICGTCVTKVLEGEVEHRDEYLTAKERTSGLFAPCCSRAKSKRLVLDL